MAFTLVATSLIQLVGEYLFSQKVREEQRVTEDLAGSMAQPLSSRDAQALYAQAASVAGQSGGRVMVLDQDGVVQADSLSLANGQRLAIQEVYYVLTGGGSTYGFYDLRRSGSSFLRTLGSGPQANGLLGVYTAPMRQGGQLQGVVLYLSDAQEVYDSLTQMQQRMAIWLLLVAVAVLLLSVMVSRIFTRPIAELSQGIQRMTNGDLSSRVTVRGHNEFSQLAEAFNMMCQRLESLDQSRNQFVSNASHELKTPLSAMKILLETLLYQEAYDPDMTREFLGDINREIDRLNAIVGDLLTLVHIDSGRMQLKPEPVSYTHLTLPTKLEV